MVKRQKIKNKELEVKITKTENVPLLILYKNGKAMHVEITRDASLFEVYGFLKCFVKDLEFDLLNKLEKE